MTNEDVYKVSEIVFLSGKSSIKINGCYTNGRINDDMSTNNIGSPKFQDEGYSLELMNDSASVEIRGIEVTGIRNQLSLLLENLSYYSILSFTSHNANGSGTYRIGDYGLEISNLNINDNTIGNLDVGYKNNSILYDDTYQYQFYKNGVLIRNLTVPTYFKLGDKVKVKAVHETEWSSEYTVNAESPNGKIEGMGIDGEDGDYDLSFYDWYGNQMRDLRGIQLHFDTVAPSKLTTTTNLAAGTYGEGTEILIYAKTQEAIDGDYILPKMEVKFGDTTGKFNNGEARCIDAIIDVDGKTKWTYLYEVQKGDNGVLNVKYEDGEIKDLAGNTKALSNETENFSNIKADTIAPTVDITVNTDNLLVDGIVEYTFEFDQEVYGFMLDDITVNNGTKGENLPGRITGDGKSIYTLRVTPTIAEGNVGDLQVIIEEGVCHDAAGNPNIRQESNIIIDRQKPTLTSYTVEKTTKEIDGANKDVLKITAIFSEAIASEDINCTIKVGGRTKRGAFEATNPTVTGNKVEFIYKISPADGGDVEAILSGTVEDVAGNESEEINVSIENNINLQQSAIIRTGGDIYQFYKNSELITDLSIPTYFKANDTIEVYNITKDDQVGQEYTFSKNSVTQDATTEPVKMNGMGVDGDTPPYTLSFSNDRTGRVDLREANLYFDAKLPKINTVINSEEKLSVGKEVIIKATTTEAIQQGSVDVFVLPTIAIKFGETAGKFNNGRAQHIETLNNEDGTTTWVYKYVVTQGDEGELVYKYDSGILTDLAGNVYNINDLPVESKFNLTDSSWNNDLSVSVEFKKNGNTISGDTYFVHNSHDLAIEATFDKALYSYYNSTYNYKIPINDTPDVSVPNLYIQGYGKQSSIESVNVDSDNNSTTILYKFNNISEKFDTLTQIKELKFVNECSLDEVKDDDGLTVTRQGELFYVDSNNVKKTLQKNDPEIVNVDKNIFIDPQGTSIIPDTNIFADTTAPTVQISVSEVENNITNKDKLTYTFTWSEEVEGFTANDITVNNGTKETLSDPIDNENGTYSYTMDIIPSVENGNVGNVQVIIEQDACQDLVAQGNVRSESIIKVDRKAPVLLSLEAHAESGLILNDDVDVVKEYYKQGDTIKVVATFDENIYSTLIPELVLQFSESGNSVIPAGTIDGNKIIYTYTVEDGDSGVLSVRAYSGNVMDEAENSMTVVKKQLDGNTIIADTDAPALQELRVIKSEGTYKAESIIEIEAIYDENVYAVKDNEIKNIDSNTAPTLKVKFGNGEEREANFSRYVGENKTKLKYTVTIADGDNGNLSIVSYNNKDNVTVCDIAGNSSTLVVNKTGNNITADTIRPEVTNIEVSVENPTITDTGIFYKEGNTVKITLTFSEEVSSNVLWPTILIGFSEEEDSEPTEYNEYTYESDWNENSETIEYSYTIQDGDNGYLWVKVPEGKFRDAGGNINVEKEAEEKLNIYADTIEPTVTLTDDLGVNQNNQIITIKAEFNENVYDLEGNIRVALTSANAPKLIYSFGNGDNIELAASSVSGNIITYIITKDPVYDNGTLLYELAKGNLCDRAGNLYYTETTDTTAPELESVVISSNAEVKYQPYCKVGTEIYVTATFNEKIKEHNMELKVKVGNIELNDSLSGEIINDRKIKYTYTVKEGDTGVFSIVDICGNTDNNMEDNKTYGYVRDEYGNQKNIYNLENISVIESAIADTTNPYITSIKAISNGKEIATYSKEEGISVGRTNGNIVEYVVTYSEKVPYDHFENISVVNGTILGITYTNYEYNEYKIIVQTIQEGVQSLVIGEATVEDVAGNIDEFIRLNIVTIDFTPPTIRFISEYNGGIYVLPTNIGKVEIRPNVEISEDISKIEYKWEDDEEYDIVRNYSSSSDIAIPARTFTQAEEYKLYIRVTDTAGNITVSDKIYRVINSEIEIDTNTSDYTNQDITATIYFGVGLTDNRKVTFKAEDSNEIVELNAIGTEGEGTIYSIWTNGTIYAEATDRVGNKVFTERTITNIDKEAPTVELSLNGGNLVIGTGEDKATIKTNVEVKNDKFIDIEYVYSNNEILSDDYSTRYINNYREAKKEDATEGTYYLHVFAKDAAGNETHYVSSEFNVSNSNTLKDEEGNVTFTPAEENTITFTREQQEVYVNYGMNLSENQKITFTNEEDGYTYDNYVEVLKPTTVTAEATDICGNKVVATFVVDSVKGPEIEVIGNPEEWTNKDIELTVIANKELSSLKFGEKAMDLTNPKVPITANGEYNFTAIDIYGNETEKTVKVTKIDKDVPVISKPESSGREITVTAEDALSGVAEYAISTTTEVPVEWSKSNVIKTTEDGIYYVWAKDNAGNVKVSEETIIVDTVVLNLEVIGNPEEWTNKDIELTVIANKELSSLKFGETAMDLTNPKVPITANGEYNFTAIDIYGNETEKTVKVTKIDKDVPVISKPESSGREITVTAGDALSGVAEYAISITTEVPVEWSKSNVIKTTEDGIYYVWAKDNAGNVIRFTDTTIIDTLAPTITFNYTSLIGTVGTQISSIVTTNENAKIAYSWDNENWVTTQEFVKTLNISKQANTAGEYILYVKATDENGRISDVKTLQFTVVNNTEEIEVPEIIFEGLSIMQIDGVKYVKVSNGMLTDTLTGKMNVAALCGKTPKYEKLTNDGKLKTGSEITIDGQTKYIVIVNGDVNCDGKIDFLGDIILANDYRIGIGTLNTMQKLAADINSDSKVDFISDILAINDYRIGITKSL